MLMQWLTIAVMVKLSLAEDNSASDQRESSVEKDGLICERDWFSFGNMCYRLGGKQGVGRMKYSDAARRCREEYHGYLATIDSKPLNDFLMTFMLLDKKTNLYFGLQDLKDETVYMWEDGNSLNKTEYTNWEPNEPSGHSRDHEDCMEMFFRYGDKVNQIGMWNDVDCNDEKPFICQKEKTKPKWNSRQYRDPRFCSPEGGWKHGGSCYYIVNNETLTWSDAEDYCVEKYKGHLATITEYTANLFLKYVIQNQERPLWIGVKIDKSGYQQWFSSGWFVSFHNWVSDRQPTEGCATIFIDGSWDSSACTEKLPFICEVSKAEPPVLPNSASGGTCPAGEWRDLGGDRCFYIDMKSEETWTDANFICMREGGTLLSLHSMAEVDMLYWFTHWFKSYVHLGFFRNKRHDENFTWADQTPVDFLNWPHDEPNTPSEQCSEFRSWHGKWNDIRCSTKLSFICSAPKKFTNLKSSFEEENMISCWRCGRFGIYALIGVALCAFLISILVGILYRFWRIRESNYDTIKSAAERKTVAYRSEMIVQDELYENID